jgi:hypothetical protein
MRNLTRNIIEKALGNYLVPGTQYPEPSKLTDELNNWYCFTSDGGHSILCLLECHLEEAFKETEDEIYKHLVPVPVKTVLKNYRVELGLIVVDLPYSFEMGLEIEDEDDNEYDYQSSSYNMSPVNEIVVLGPEVGELYHPAVRHWPQCAQFNVRCGIGELVLFYNSPQIFETAAVEKSECEFGIMVSGDVIFFLYRFGDKGRLGIGWADQPFSIRLVPEGERLVPKITNDEQRLPLFIYLVNALECCGQNDTCFYRLR